MFKITIVTVSWRSAELIEKLLCNLHQKALCPDRIKVLVIDNTNGKDAAIGKLKSDFECSVRKIDCQGLSGSRAHACGLDHAMELIDTEFTLVVDPDIYVFKDHWDQFCIDQVNEQNAVAIGAPFPHWKVGKYHDFPSPPFSFFVTCKIIDLQAGWEPFSKTSLGLAGKFIVRQLGRLGPFVTRNTYTKYKFIRDYSAFAEKTLGICAPDTGWRIAEKAREQKFKSIMFRDMLPCDIPDTNDSAKQALNDLAANYELFFYKQEPVLVHKYGSAGWPWRTKRGRDESFQAECIKKLEQSYKENDR